MNILRPLNLPLKINDTLSVHDLGASSSMRTKQVQFFEYAPNRCAMHQKCEPSLATTRDGAQPAYKELMT